MLQLPVMWFLALRSGFMFLWAVPVPQKTAGRGSGAAANSCSRARSSTTLSSVLPSSAAPGQEVEPQA